MISRRSLFRTLGAALGCAALAPVAKAAAMPPEPLVVPTGTPGPRPRIDWIDLTRDDLSGGNVSRWRFRCAPGMDYLAVARSHFYPRAIALEEVEERPGEVRGAILVAGGRGTFVTYKDALAAWERGA